MKKYRYFGLPSHLVAMAGLSVALTLTACGGANEGNGEVAGSRAAVSMSASSASGSSIVEMQIPSAEQTEELLKKGSDLNAAELQAAAARVGVTAPATAQWPSSPTTLASPKFAIQKGKPQSKALGFASVPVYRFFNSQTAAHFYTISETERDTVRSTLPQFSYEGAAFSVSPAAQPGLSPVYRFLNTQSGVHFYTISEDEKNHILQTLPGFNLEGVAYYASKVAAEGFTELGRFYVPGKGFHFYTASSMEALNISLFLSENYGWEGFAYYVIGEDYSFDKAMHDELNTLRVQGGFGAMAHNSALDAAARNHANYMYLNYRSGNQWNWPLMSSVDPATGWLTGHTETLGSVGFTGVFPIDRAATAGFNTSYVGEVIEFGNTGFYYPRYAGCIDGLLSTVFHRSGLLYYGSREFGSTVMFSPDFNDFVCIIEPAINPANSPQPPAGWVAVYPVPDQQNVKTLFFNEAPDPVPSSPIKGNPASIYVEPQNTLTVFSFVLRDPSGASVPAKLLTSADFPAYLATYMAYLVPLGPLNSNTEYTAHFVGQNSGAPLVRTWSFHTK
jgi:uncharacterized protein YkwD